MSILHQNPAIAYPLSPERAADFTRRLDRLSTPVLEIIAGQIASNVNEIAQARAARDVPFMDGNHGVIFWRWLQVHVNGELSRRRHPEPCIIVIGPWR